MTGRIKCWFRKPYICADSGVYDQNTVIIFLFANSLLPYDAPMARLCLMERKTKIWTAFLDSRSSCFVVLFKSTEGKDDCFIVQKDHTFA